MNYEKTGFIWLIDFADAPYEKFYVHASAIKQDVLKEMFGVLTVTIPGSLDEFRQETNGTMELGGRKWIFVSDIEPIKTYAIPVKTFHAPGTLPRAKTLPQDEWLCESWNGNAFLKFPIVNSQGAYRRILYDPLHKLTAWVKPAEYPPPSAYVFVPEVEQITTYTPLSGAFVADGKLNFTDVVPISGWSWTGTISERIVTVRLPIVGKHGPYRQVVYNPLLGLTMWIHLPTVAGVFESRSGYDIREVYFTEEYFKQDASPAIFVDLFFLLQTRSLYHAPEESARGAFISPAVQDPNSPEGSHFGHGYITKIQNGFELVSDLNSCTGKERQIGWIKLRNQTGRLTVWPVIPLSC